MRANTRTVFHVLYMVTILLYVMLMWFITDFFMLTPIGFDFYVHATKVKWVLEEPFARWAPQWYAGFSPFRYYPPLPYWFFGVPVKIFNMTIEASILIVTIISLIGVIIGVYLVTYEISNLRSAAAISSFLCASSPALWAYIVRFGFPQRIVATMISLMAIWLAIRFVKASNTGVQKKKIYVLLIAVMVLALFSHMLLAIMTVAATFLYFIAGFKSLRQKFSNPIKIISTSIGLLSFYYIPFLIPPRVKNFIVGGFPPINPTVFIGVNAPELWPVTEPTLSPLIFPVIISAIIICLFRRRRLDRANKTPGAITFGMVSLILLYYAEQGFLPRLIPQIDDPRFIAPYFLSIYLSILAGLLISYFNNFRKAYTCFTAFTLILLASWSIFLPLSINGHSLQPMGHLSMEDKEGLDEALRITGKDYRIAPIYPVPYVPSLNFFYEANQAFGYFPQGDFYPDRTYWFSYSLSNFKDVNEVRFLLDWYGVKCIIASKELSLSSPLPEDFERISIGHIDFIVYKNATPIIMATDASVMLFIGGTREHSFLLKTLSYQNINSKFLVMVKGSEYVDDYSLRELTTFSSIILYGWKYRSVEEAERLLSKYVEAGGKLIILSDPPKLPTPLPKFYPIDKLTVGEFQPSWKAKLSANAPVTVDFSRFSPLLFGDGNWSASFSANEHVRPWASVWMWSQDHPIIVYGRLGDGGILWVGANLPYHALYYDNKYESAFLVEVFRVIQGWEPSGWAFAKHERPNFETLSTVINKPYRGLVVKESYAEGWWAIITDSLGRPYLIKIYEAGPNMMYIFLPSEASYPVKVVFKYGPDIPHLIGYALSLVTLTILTYHLLKRKPPVKRDSASCVE